MIFTSLMFLAFLPIVFAAYWFVGRSRIVVRNVILIVASFVFYGWMDARMCGLLALSIACAYFTGLWIACVPRQGRLACGLSLALNLGILGFFKYYNFFANSLSAVFSSIGFDVDVPTLKIILPIGISFYSFMSISYTIDVMRGTVQAVRNPHVFFSYMSFFPQLLSGPIGKASEMVPQFSEARAFDADLAIDGCRQMLWGYFKKIVIANGCASLTKVTFGCSSAYSGSVLLVGAFMYAIQIYADFSGYSDLAIGCGKLFGIRLKRNFAYPYFATNIADFWRRWHISLMNWFRDYVYIPLGGNRCSKGRRIFNTFVVFLLSGLWHGANWTFVVWGLVHACFFLPLLLLAHQKKTEGVSAVRAFIGWALTFSAVMLAWVFFHADTISAACDYLSKMFSRSLFTMPTKLLSMLPWIAVCMIVEWFQRKREHALQIGFAPAYIRWAVYFAVAIICVAYQERESEFIYFQF